MRGVRRIFLGMTVTVVLFAENGAGYHGMNTGTRTLKMRAACPIKIQQTIVNEKNM